MFVDVIFLIPCLLMYISYSMYVDNISYSMSVDDHLLFHSWWCTTRIQFLLMYNTYSMSVYVIFYSIFFVYLSRSLIQFMLISFISYSISLNVHLEFIFLILWILYYPVDLHLLFHVCRSTSFILWLLVLISYSIYVVVYFFIHVC